MNMYVSNLSFNTGDNELYELFAAHGKVMSAKVVLDRETSRSRGFGFVEMTDNDEAQTAMSALNNKEIEGRPLSVSEARPKTNNSYSKNSQGSSRRGGFDKW